MGSDTVLNVLPEGGDSRKQVMINFVIAVIGCGVFASYASGLFLRSKSCDIGIFLALGASKNLLRNMLLKELVFITFLSCTLGTVLGAPAAWLIWKGFRTFIVDSTEMKLSFNHTAILFAVFFSVFVIFSVFIMGIRFIGRSNIIDIVNETRKT